MATLEWDFRVVNANTVERALAGIERRVAVHNQRIARTLGQSGRAPGRGAGGGSAGSAANQETAFANKVAVDRLRAETKANLAIQKSQLKRVETVERSELSAINRAKAARLSGVAQEKAFTSKIAIEKMRADAKAQLSGQKMAFQRVQSAERAELSAIRRIESARISSDARAARAAAQELKVRARAADQAWKARERASIKTGRAVGSSVTGAVGGVGRLAGAALSIGGGFALAGALSAQQSEAAQASDLANQAGTPEQKGQLLKEARSVRGATGAEALSGMGEFYTKTGDMSTARQMIGQLSDLSIATGTDLGEMGATAGEVFNVLKDQISDPVERMKQMGDVMRTLAQQGSMGAVEIRDLATQFGKLGGATRDFEGGAPELLKMVGAFAQVSKAAGGSSSAEDAATSVARLGSDIVTNKKKFKALGVNIKSTADPTKLRNPMEIIADVLDKTGGDVEKTSGLLGMESRKVLKGFTGTYGEAEKKEKGSGKAAVMAKFQEFAGANLSQEDINERVGSRMEDSDMQFKEAMKKFNAAMGTQMLPAITKLIPKFVELIEPMTKFAAGAAKVAEYLIDNPLKGLGAIVGAKITADIAGAKLSEVLAKTVATSLGKSLGIIGIAAATFEIGTAAIDILFNEKASMQKENVRRTVNAANLQGRAISEMRDGGLTDATHKELQTTKSALTASGATPTTAGLGQLLMSAFLKMPTPGISELLKNSVTGSGPGISSAFTVPEQEQRRSNDIADAAQIQKILELAAKAAGDMQTSASKMAANAINRSNQPTNPVK